MPPDSVVIDAERTEGLQFPQLDVLRTVLALYIVVGHLRLDDRLTVFDYGLPCVEVFFVLSGFVIAHTHRELRRGSEAARFLWWRVARIYPLHLVTTLAWIPVVMLKHLGFGSVTGGSRAIAETPETFVQHLFLFNAHGASDAFSWNYPAWSLGAEFTAYLVFAAAMLVPWRWKWGTLLVLSTAGRGWLLASGRDPAHFGFLSGLSLFVLGVCLRRSFDFSNARPAWRASGFVPHLLGMTGILAVLLPGAILQIGTAWAAVALVGGLVRWRWAPLARLGRTEFGRVSFGIYLIHPLLLAVSYEGLRRLGLCTRGGVLGSEFGNTFAHPAVEGGMLLWGLCASYGLAVLSYRWFEEPCRRALRRAW